MNVIAKCGSLRKSSLCRMLPKNTRLMQDTISFDVYRGCATYRAAIRTSNIIPPPAVVELKQRVKAAAALLVARFGAP